MATSKSEICNLALSKYGGKRIQSLTDDSSPEARLCLAVYDPLRIDLLERHSWNCAVNRAQLNQLTSTPAFDYSYEYELPSDCLRVLTMKYQDSYPFVIEGQKLLTNYTVANVRYIMNLQDVSKFSSRFSMTLAAYIAAVICYNLTESRPMQEQAYAEFKEAFMTAKNLDGQEGENEVEDVSSDWITERYISRSPSS